jgi:hypothetical protein
MWGVLILALAAGDAVSEAGASYRRALEELETERYEEAVQLLRDAVQRVGSESDELKYRDSVARRRHSYYPYFEWARARQLQARREPSIFNRRDLLKDALSKLSQTKHPEATQLTEEVKTDLEAVEKAIELDGSFASAKTRIEVLGTGERFEEALQQLDGAAKSFITRQKEIADLRNSLKERQIALERRYEQLLAQRLGDVALTDPVAAGESVAGILKPAMPPKDAIAKPGLPFQWLSRFIELWDKQLETARRAGDLSAEEINAMSGAFEAVALDALQSRMPPGFRAARHIAHALRMAKLNRIATGSEDTIDTKTAAVVVQYALQTSARAADGLSKVVPEGDTDLKSLENDVPTRQKAIEDLGKKIVDGDKERTRLTAPIVMAETSLADGQFLGDAEALAKLKNTLFELESEANFGTLTNRLRARALLAHAVAEAMLAFLEGNPPARVLDRCRTPAWRAFGFDPKVDVRWAGKLSPKLLKILEESRPK